MKPPIAFVVFMLMALFIKTREWRYCRNGNTHADYEAFLKTNRNSLHFSLFMAVLLVTSIIVNFYGEMKKERKGEEEEVEEQDSRE